MQALENSMCQLRRLLLQTRMINTILASEDIFPFNFQLDNNNLQYHLREKLSQEIHWKLIYCFL